MNGPKKLECYKTLQLERLGREKHSSLLVALVSYEENKVLCTQIQGLYSQHFISLVTYEWVQ
jgi:hypothetical protein